MTTETRDVLLEKADRLREIATHLGLQDLAGTIGHDTRRRLDDSRVRAAVLGEIKQGKSSLINAMIGTESLPTGVTPTTGAVVLVHVGDEPGQYLIEDGKRQTLDDERFARLARGRKRGEAAAAGEELELVVPKGTLPDSLELVDTPGVNDIAKFRAAVSRGELPRADILILVLDATQLLNRSEMAFLRDAITAVGGLEDSGAALLIAVNRIDLIAERERPKLVEHLERELGSLSGGKDKPFELFMTDARTAARNPSADTPGARDVARLKQHLFALASDRGDVLPARARAGLLRHTSLLSHNAAIASRALTLELDALKREISTLERELSDFEADMTTLRGQMANAREDLIEQSGGRIDAFRGQLEQSIAACLQAASLRALSSHLGGSIHDAFLAFAEGEAEHLRTGLDEVTRKVIHTHSEQARRRLFRATLRFGFRGPTVYLDPPSVVLEAGLVAISVAGTAVMYLGSMVAGLLMTVAGPLATVVLRERSLRTARATAKAELPAALETATDALRDQIRKVIDGHLAALDEHLLLANVALGEQLTGVLRRAAHDLEGEGESSEGVGRRRASALAELHGLEHELAKIRRELEAV